MLITSKFQQACKVCSKVIEVGDRIAWTRGERGASHAACSDEGKRVLELVQASRATDAAVDLPCPEGHSYLGFQRAGIAFALTDTRKGTLIADEMGLGKTVQAIGVINATVDIRDVVVVCPASLKLNWRNELRRWLVNAFQVNVWPGDVGKSKTMATVDVVNYDLLHKLPKDKHYDLLILDEAHYIKNPKSLRTKRAQELASRCKRVLALTGTPVLARPLELWPLLQVVAPDQWDPPGWNKAGQVGAGKGAGFWRFVKRYCNAHEEWHGRTKHWDFSGASNQDELQEKLRSTCMVRRLKQDVLTELPPKRRQVVVLPNEGYDESETPALDGLTPDTWEDVVSKLRGEKSAFEEISRVRHDTGLAKVPAVVDHVRSVLEAKDKVIVFAHHHDVVSALSEGLRDFAPMIITGDTAVDMRQLRVEAFQTSPNARVIIGTIGAMGVGHTLTAADHVVFAEFTWTPAEVTQAEDRPHRIGQTGVVTVEHVVWDGTLDARMAQVLVHKQNIADAVLDDGLALEADLSLRRAPVTPTQPTLPEGLADKTLDQLRYLSACCDGAKALDGMGFNGMDTHIGKALAKLERLSARQTVFAVKMLTKYTKQLQKGGW